MKKITFIASLILSLFAFNQSFSQKVVIIGMNHISSGAPNDGFTFVATENIPAGEVIYFTENEYSDTANAFTFNGAPTGEAVIRYEVGAGGLAKGVVVFMHETSSNVFTITCSSGNCGTSTTSTSFGNGSFNLATNGDSLYAYSDTNENVLDGVTQIYSAMYTGSGEAPVQNGGNIPVDMNPVSDFPNAIIVDGFADDGDFSIGPNRVEYKFNPATLRDAVSKVSLENVTNYLSYASSQDLSIVPFTNLNLTGSNPIATVATSPTSLNENSGSTYTYTFSLDSNATIDTTINFSVSGSAIFNTDYSQSGATTFNSTSGTVIIASGTSYKTITLTPTGDSTLEPDENIILTLASGTGYDSGSPSTATAVITNDDSQIITPLVAITGTNNETTEGFSFVALNDIVAGTTIYFTDNEFNNSSLTFNSGEFVASWTAPIGGILRGEVIVVKETSTNSFTTSCNSGTCGIVTLHAGSFALATNGETLNAYTDSDTNPTNGITAIQAVLYTGNSSNSGGNIPIVEDPTSVYSGSVLVDGFSTGIIPKRTEYNPTLRTVDVDQANFQNTTNWFYSQANQDLSIVPFSNIIITTGSPNPLATVAISPSSVIEDSGNSLVYIFSLDTPASGNVVLNFTVGGTGTFTTDYTVTGSTSFNSTIGSVTILDGTSSASVNITPVIDTTVETLEDIELIIASGTGYNGGSPNNAIGTISNDDTSNSDPLVAISGMSHLTTDGFSFVAIRDIPAGTIVYFSEDEFDNTTLKFSSGEALIQWTSPATGIINKGDVIVITETGTDIFTTTCSDSSGNGCGTITVLQGNSNLSTGGDSLYAFTDDDTDPTNGVSDIHSVMYTGGPSGVGGSIPINEDPSGIYLNALVVDGFPTSNPNRTEYDETKRNVLVENADFENVTNWVHAQSPPALSTAPFTNLAILIAPTITFNDINKTYGDVSFDLAATSNSTGNITYSIIGLANGTSLSGTNNETVTLGNAGTVTIRATQASDGITYGEATKDITLTIGKAALTVTANASQTKVYGATDPTLTYTITGFVNGDVEGDIDTAVSISRATGENVGNYTITPSGAADTNYTVSFVTAQFSITKAALTITANASQTKVYGTTDSTLTYTITGFVNGDVEGDLDTAVSISRATGENVGNYTITPSGAADTNYTVSFVTAQFSITKAALTITANVSQTKVYGATDPTLTYTITGFVNGDVEGDLDTATSISRATGEDVGNYTITPSGAADTNYAVSFVTAQFSITKAALTVTANASQTKVYGATDPTLTYTITGFVNGDVEGDLDTAASISRATGEDVGNYTITPSGAADTNYAVSFITAQFSITKAALTVTANASQTKVYGATDPTLTYTITGFVNGDVEGDLDTAVSISRATGENVGNYTITPSGAADTNYTVSFVTAQFSITKAALTVTANASQTKVYGTTDPTLTYTITGFVNGDVEGDLDTAVSISRATGENVGDYTITLSGGFDNNYSFNLYNGIFTINKKEITITADPKSKIYCDTDPELTYQITLGELEIGDSFSGSLIRVIGENVGSYSISIGTVSAGENYNLSFKSEDLTITIKTVTISCPPDLEINTDQGSCSANGVDLGTVLINEDDCSVALAMNDAPAIFPKGITIVTWTVKDNLGNITEVTCEQIVTVKDNEVPTVVTQNISLGLDADGLATITSNQIDNGSSDNCSIDTMELDITNFDCSNVGDNTVTLTVKDINGNIASQTATVIIEDDNAPIVLTKNMTLELDADGLATITSDQIDNGSSDNCSIETISLDIKNFDCSNIGENTVTLTVTDINNNTASNTAIITIVDSISPIAICSAPFTIELDETGNAIITVDDINNGSFDNCSVTSLTIDKNSFDCSSIGEHTVTLTVEDGNGNSTNCSTIVTVKDVTAPIVITQNISVELDENGQVLITPEEIDEDSFDSCGIVSMSLDQTTFNCPTLGEHIVTLTVIDTNGNSASEEAIVTITADDLDGDFIADVCDDDLDGDGVNNDLDNCPSHSNPDQADLDRNGVGDVCDTAKLLAPKGFSPNGDGLNDYFIIAGLHKYPNNTIEIFNRWGNLVYKSKGYQNYWDGIAKGNGVFNKNELLPAGPYFYVLSINGGSKVIKEWVYINY